VKRRAPNRPASGGAVWLRSLSAFALAVALADAGAQASGASDAEPSAAGDTLRAANYCGALAATPWPTTALARRALLQRLEALRRPCVGHAGYLSTLGALWLEEGEPAQALLWLERALLLDPSALGTLADHALALAALGETAARDALAQQWRDRADIPAALRQRLAMGPAPANGQARSGNAPPPLALAPPDGWVSYRDVSVHGGYESNLDHFTKATEITLTDPDLGPDPRPIDRRPRKGFAVMSDLSWQLARSPLAGSVVQAGVEGGARHAPGRSETDYHHLQIATAASQRWGPWRAQIHANGAWIGGQLSEPYRLLRLGLSVDREAVGCSHRLTLDIENRIQSATRTFDSQASSVGWNSLCPVPGRDWILGLAARWTQDRPDDPSRPGGRQRQATLGARLIASVGAGLRMDATVRLGRIDDSSGYSPLLEYGAIRHMNQSQFSVEFSKPVPLTWLYGAEAVVQLQAVRQRSNLVLFSYDGVSTYGGLRWRW
jgi:hypothetical protein